MKRALVTTLGVVLAFAAMASAQKNPRATAKLTLNGAAVSVEYGRPSLKGRNVNDLLGKLGAGEFWRLGADTSTTFSTSKDLQFGEVTVPKGQYSLWAQKQSDNSWKLVFNKQHGQWGTQHDASQDLYSVPLKGENAEKAAEMVTIALEEENGAGELSIQWGSMEMSADFTAK